MHGVHVAANPSAFEKAKLLKLQNLFDGKAKKWWLRLNPEYEITCEQAASALIEIRGS